MGIGCWAGLVVGRAGRGGSPLAWASGWGMGELGSAHGLGGQPKGSSVTNLILNWGWEPTGRTGWHLDLGGREGLGTAGAWELDFEIDGLGGSMQAMTSNFYLLLSRVFC